MKKTVAILILTFMMLGIFVGCTPQGNSEGDDNLGSEGGNTQDGGNEGGNTQGGGSNDYENEEDNPPEGIAPGTNPENPEQNPEEPEQKPENPEQKPEEPEQKPEDIPNVEGENKPQVGTSVGDLFADLTLRTVNGGSVNTADHRGKIIILNIWATWCPPCQAELPDFNRIATDYKNEAVIIAAHTPNGNSATNAYVQTNFPDTDIIFAYDTVNSDAFFAAGGINSIPQTVIIDQNGVIIYVHTGMMSYASLAEIINSHS